MRKIVFIQVNQTYEETGITVLLSYRNKKFLKNNTNDNNNNNNDDDDKNNAIDNSNNFCLRFTLMLVIVNCVNNKMLEYDWLLTGLIYGLIGCFRSKLSDFTCLITNIRNRTGQIGQLSSQ